jgi:heat shock factor-binding protein 1
MPSSALPLKVPSTPAKNGENDKDKTPMAASKQNPAAKSGTLVPSDISSPHELTAFVSTLVLYPMAFI